MVSLFKNRFLGISRCSCSFPTPTPTQPAAFCVPVLIKSLAIYTKLGVILNHISFTPTCNLITQSWQFCCRDIFRICCFFSFVAVSLQDINVTFSLTILSWFCTPSLHLPYRLPPPPSCPVLLVITGNTCFSAYRLPFIPNWLQGKLFKY